MIDLTQKVIDHCLKINEPQYNILKLIEESCELSEVATKFLTKNPDSGKQPDRDRLLEEVVDVMFRSSIALQSIFKDLTEDEISEKLEQYYETKIIKYSNYIDNNKFDKNL